MERIVIFGGTTEGRLLTEALSKQPADLTVCVATEYGKIEQGELNGVTVHSGRLDVPGMEQLLKGARLCVDATHPYAKEASRNIREACRRTGVAYKRLLREQSELPQGAVAVSTAEEAADYLAERSGNILLTTGSKELSAFSRIGRRRLYVRVLPLVESLKLCEAAGILPANILALQGPFSRELNEALIRQFKIDYLVTKDGGSAGGFGEKAAAAQNTGTSLIVLTRQKEDGESFEQVLRECEEMLR